MIIPIKQALLEGYTLEAILEATALKKHKLLKEAKINYTNAKNFVTRNIKDSKGDLLKGKELAQAKIKLGLPLNNDLQMIRSNMRKFGDRELGYQKINNRFDDSSKVIGTNTGVNSIKDSKGKHVIDQLHTHPGIPIKHRTKYPGDLNSLPSGTDISLLRRVSMSLPAGTNLKETVVAKDGVSVSNIRRLNQEKIYHPEHKYLDNLEKLSKIRTINFER